MRTAQNDTKKDSCDLPIYTSKENWNTNNALPQKIAVLYTDAKREYFVTEDVYITEKDSEKEANVIASYIQKLGIDTICLPGDQKLIDNLKKSKPDMVFNLVGSVRGDDYLGATVPALLDFLDIPYTGTDFFGFALGADKFLIKKVMEQAGIPVPNYQLFTSHTEPVDSRMKFPLISKLNELNCATEINNDSVSENEKHLRERLKYLITTYKQPVIVEEFIAGREITAIYLEGLNKKVYLGEKVFNKPGQKYLIATFEDQWSEKYNNVEEHEWPHAYSKFEDPILKELVKKCADVTKMIDYGKLDIRIDHAGRYFFIDANSNPAFGPKELYPAIALILNLYGISFLEILRRIILNTVQEVVTEEPQIKTI